MTRRRLRFFNGQTLRIVAHQSFPDMNGMVGHVVRVCSRGDKAWIKTREPLPVNRRSFPPGDERCDHALVYHDEVEEVAAMEGRGPRDG
jgi:hypothetical protein